MIHNGILLETIVISVMVSIGLLLFFSWVMLHLMRFHEKCSYYT